MGLSLKERDRRYAAIRKLMEKENLDCLVCVSRDTYTGRGYTRYLSNHGNNFGEQIVMFPIEGEPSILASTIRGPAIERAGWVHNFIPHADSFERAKQTKQELARLDRGNKIGIAGLTLNITVPVYLAVQEQCPNRVVDAGWILDQVRAVKSQEEIERMRISASIADKAFAAVRDMLRPGVSDYEVYAEAKSIIHKMGCEYSMELVAIHADQVGYPWGDVMNSSDRLLFEFTPAYEGYYTQLLANMPVGEYKPEVRKVIPIWEEVFAIGVDNLRPGKKVSEVHRAVSTAIRERGGAHIGHRFGHSLGLDAIDSWEIVPGENTELKSGMTLTFHPQVFLGHGSVSFLGGYTYLITDTGVEKLNAVNFVSR